MGTLQEVAGLILLQVNHNRECGKDDKFTKDEIADIIHMRVEKKDLIAIVVGAKAEQLVCDCGHPNSVSCNKTNWKLVCSKCLLPKAK
jgi:hypothetical protein